jgi:hypothetical protein
MGEGILLLAGYDLLRAWRRSVVHGTLWVAAEDFIYWTGSGILHFSLSCWKRDGILRIYDLAAIALGMGIYHFCVSSRLLSVEVWILSKTYAILSKIRMIIRNFLTLFCKKILEKWKRVLKKGIKEVRMTLIDGREINK